MNSSFFRRATATIGMILSCALAEAQVLVEIEGKMSSYVPTTSQSGTMTVMNNKIAINEATQFLTPTQTRVELFGQRNEAGA